MRAFFGLKIRPPDTTSGFSQHNLNNIIKNNKVVLVVYRCSSCLIKERGCLIKERGCLIKERGCLIGVVIFA
jgi:hypothetical protein